MSAPAPQTITATSGLQHRRTECARCGEKKDRFTTGGRCYVCNDYILKQWTKTGAGQKRADREMR